MQLEWIVILKNSKTAGSTEVKNKWSDEASLTLSKPQFFMEEGIGRIFFHTIDNKP